MVKSARAQQSLASPNSISSLPGYPYDVSTSPLHYVRDVFARVFQLLQVASAVVHWLRL
jgi:hypothetical protein